EYVLAAIPLGGFVKMLGEGPEEEASKSTDPRAYPNKTVGARMAIISAGVIMNLIFGLICFTYVYLRGKEETEPVIGAVLAGQPAYEAGLRAGDRILRIDGKPIETYSDISHATIFSGKGQILVIDLKRPGVKEPVRIELSPHTREGGLAPTMGATSAQSLTLISKVPFLPSPGLEGDAKALKTDLKGGGRVIAAGAEGSDLRKVTTDFEFDAILLKNRDKPVEIELERTVEPESKSDPDAKPVVRRREVTLPPNRFVSLGLRLTPGSVVAIRENSPAAKAGFKEGDHILSIDGQADYDPMRLPDLAYDRAGEAMVFEVERPLGDTKPPQRLTLTAEPDDSPIWIEELAAADEPLDVPGLGLALGVEPKIAAVEPDSPASKAGLKPGEVLKAVHVTMTPVPLKEDEKPEPQTTRFVLDGPKDSKTDVRASWPLIFDALQRPLDKLELELGTRSRPVALTPEPVDNWFNPDRGLNFKPLTFRLPPQPLPAALARGWGDTVHNVSAIYYLIRGLFQQRLSKDAVGGPIPIAHWAYTAAQTGFDEFVMFLAVLSINLAVINFLPVPPLDGGQFLLLLAEKIYGRPLPEKAVGPFQLVGLTLLLLLIVVVNLKDILGYFF
ncbi:MAG TPA: site-2 protease family protein, partial [Isosphaeraceae bacterium]|nr:site-2 protease family protein [Isosphaeraceae bacterium]